jgi:hypothetical protein
MKKILIILFIISSLLFTMCKGESTMKKEDLDKIALEELADLCKVAHFDCSKYRLKIETDNIKGLTEKELRNRASKGIIYEYEYELLGKDKVYIIVFVDEFGSMITSTYDTKTTKVIKVK